MTSTPPRVSRQGATDDSPATPTQPGWRLVLALVTLVPALVVAIAAMFVSLAVDPAPHKVPLGLVAPPSVAAQVGDALADQAGEDAFAITTYASVDEARTAVGRREISGAIAPGPTGVQVLTADAGSPVLAQIITAVGTGIGEARSVPVDVEPVVPNPTTDPRGTGFAAGLLPLLIAGIALGAAAAVAVRGRAVLQATVAVLGPLVAGFGFAAVWSWLGVLDDNAMTVGFAAALMIAAMSWTALGAGTLLGTPGVGLAAILLVLISNPLSGLASSPYLLPAPWGTIGQWLPPGAGGTLLRSVAYFPDASIAGPTAVLSGWIIAGAALFAVGVLRRQRVS